MAKVNAIQPILTERDMKRFWSYVDKSEGLGPKGECWEWTNRLTHDGYGIFNIFLKRKGRPLRAHRVTYLILTGEWPTLLICHRCDNRKCVRPEHLFKGTNLDNQQDAKQKGRFQQGDNHYMRKYPDRRPWGDANPMRKYPEKRLTGEKNGNSTLSTKDALSILQMSSNGISGRSICRQTGFALATIQRVINRTTWKHLTLPLSSERVS